MKKIPFTIEIRKKTYTGYLSTTDISDPPKTFFVFIDNYIVGDLLYRNKWLFEPGNRQILGKLNSGEKEWVAEYLGNIAVLAYE